MKAADSQNSKNSSPERDLGKNGTERKETDTTVNVEVPASEESFTSEIKQVEAAPVSFTSMSVEEYKEDEKPNDKSIEIIELTTENFPMKEETILNNAREPIKS